VPWQWQPIVAHPVVAVSAGSLLHLPKLLKVHAEMENSVNGYPFALVAVGLIHSLVAVPQRWNDVHICEDIPEISMELDDLDGNPAFALDTVGEPELDILGRICLLVLEWLANCQPLEVFLN
jgi:hypothetical protein